MTTYSPRTTYSDSIKRPDYPRCGTRMMLARIASAKANPGHDDCTFDCPKCGNELIEMCKFK